MIHSKRSKPARAAPGEASKKQSMVDLFEEALAERNFSKAVAMLEFFKGINQSIGDRPVNPWLGYAAFHTGDYNKAAEVYKEMLVQDDCDPVHWLHLACCYFNNGQYKEAQDAAKKGSPCNLRNRLLFHLAQKFNDDKLVADYHNVMEDTIEDQLSIAAMHFVCGHYQEATDVYKRILMNSREFIAINVYTAMCYYKLDFYDVSMDVLNIYMGSHTDSAVAITLKACNQYRLNSGQVAEAELRILMDQQSSTYNVENDILRHNLVVFRNGADALQVLPSLVDVVVPEARLNLAIYYIRNDQILEANDLMKDFQPKNPVEHIIKAVVNALIGQKLDSRDHLKVARDLFQMIGSSPSECDTIPGRQCMASCFFMLKQFSEVLVYLNSIKAYFTHDDTFLYMYGITCAMNNEFAEAEEALSAIKLDKIRQEYSCFAWLARCHIMNRHPKKAWDIYLKMDTNAESFLILQIIANDCYRIGSFYYAAKAFDVLCRLDNGVDYIDGLRGACAGVLQLVAAGKEPSESLSDVIHILENSAKTHQEAGRAQYAKQDERVASIIRSWAKDNNTKRK